MEYLSCNSYQGCLLLLSYLELKMADNLKARKHTPPHTPTHTNTPLFTPQCTLNIYIHSSIMCTNLFMCIFFSLSRLDQLAQQDRSQSRSRSQVKMSDKQEIVSCNCQKKVVEMERKRKRELCVIHMSGIKQDRSHIFQT